MTSQFYQTQLLEHYRTPHNRGSLVGATVTSEGFNANCGDKIRLGVFLNQQVIEKFRYEIRACAICTASVSIMTDQLTGKTTNEALAELESLNKALSGQHHWPEGYEALSGIAQSINRHRCIRLGWDACAKALAADP